MNSYAVAVPASWEGHQSYRSPAEADGKEGMFSIGFCYKNEQASGQLGTVHQEGRELEKKPQGDLCLPNTSCHSSSVRELSRLCPLSPPGLGHLFLEPQSFLSLSRLFLRLPFVSAHTYQK